ncbi:MAG: DinB family protein [Vicinamibacterales bacterium]
MAVGQPLNLERELLEAFDHGGRVNEYLVSVLPRPLWHAPPPGGSGPTIGAIVAHMQSVRRTFAKMGGAGSDIPSLDRIRSTPVEARRAFRESNETLMTLFRGSLARGEARVKGMPRRVVNMMIYLLQHDAHHRGQICSLARSLDHEFSKDDIMRLWGWKKLP